MGKGNDSPDKGNHALAYIGVQREDLFEESGGLQMEYQIYTEVRKIVECQILNFFLFLPF